MLNTPSHSLDRSRMATDTLLDILPGLKAEDSNPNPGRFTFLVDDQLLGASRFPYRVQGQVMCPVRWSLKNQRTAPAQPIADVLRGIGVGVCVIVAAVADKRMFLARTQRATAMTTFAGIGRWNFLHSDTSELCFIENKRFQLEERPIVPVLSRICLRRLPLSGARPDARQVFEAYASMTTLCKFHHVF